MIILTGRDLKQMLMIKKEIYLFEEHKLDLFEIIRCLNALLSELESVSDSWKDEFQSEINTLEMIHLSIEDGSISRWEGSYKKDMWNAISKLKNITIYTIEKYLEVSDLNVLESAIEGDANWLICPRYNDAWESNSLKAMVVCPKCECALHNSRISKKIKD